MIRICVDCGAVLGTCCPHCGDTTHKPASSKAHSITCGACWRSYEKDSINSTTGGFCESCLGKRLAGVSIKTRGESQTPSKEGSMSVPLPPWPINKPQPKPRSPKRPR